MWTSLIDACFKGRFLFLLISLLGYLILAPLFKGFVGIKLLLGIFTTAIFITAIYAVSQKRHFFVIGSLLALPMIAAHMRFHGIGLQYLVPGRSVPGAIQLVIIRRRIGLCGTPGRSSILFS